MDNLTKKNLQNARAHAHACGHVHESVHSKQLLRCGGRVCINGLSRVLRPKKLESPSNPARAAASLLPEQSLLLTRGHEFQYTFLPHGNEHAHHHPHQLAPPSP